jgi:uncharacterized protein (DUF427 family)
MARAIWNDTVIAQSDATVMVEGNHYFPPNSLSSDHLREIGDTSVCPWKGTASYYDIVVGDEVNPGAAWYYPAPKDAAANIKDHVAFWRGVTIEP